MCQGAYLLQLVMAHRSTSFGLQGTEPKDQQLNLNSHHITQICIKLSRTTIYLTLLQIDMYECFRVANYAAAYLKTSIKHEML